MQPLPAIAAGEKPGILTARDIVRFHLLGHLSSATPKIRRPEKGFLYSPHPWRTPHADPRFASVLHGMPTRAHVWILRELNLIILDVFHERVPADELLFRGEITYRPLERIAQILRST
jgi:hypothetical protein